MDVKEITSCCGPVLAAPLAEAEAEELAAAFKVVADPVRLRLLRSSPRRARSAPATS